MLYKLDFFEDEVHDPHPLSRDVQSTENIEKIYSEINYAKASAILHYLDSLEPACFRSLVGDLLKSNMNATVTTGVFEEMLESYYGKVPRLRNLHPEQLFRQPGSNVLQPHIQYSQAEKITKIKVTQTVFKESSYVLRAFTVNALLFSDEQEAPEQYQAEFHHMDHVTSVKLDKKIIAVLLNFDDAACVCTTLDDISREFFTKDANFLRFKDATARAAVWKALLMTYKVEGNNMKQILSLLSTSLRSRLEPPLTSLLVLRKVSRELIAGETGYRAEASEIFNIMKEAVSNLGNEAPDAWQLLYLKSIYRFAFLPDEIAFVRRLFEHEIFNPPKGKEGLRLKKKYIQALDARV